MGPVPCLAALAAVLVASAGLLAGCSAGEDAEVGSTVQAIGQPPVNSLPTPQTVNEDSTLIFSGLDGNAITVSDLDNGILTVQISVTNGTFTLSGTTGLTVTGNGTLDMIATGLIEDLNNALEKSRYRPAANFAALATLQINTSDSNGEHDLDVLSITVTAFNDPPVNVVPTTVQSATEDVPKAFALSVTDPDIGSDPMLVTLAGTNSTTITLPTVSGLTFTAGDGAGDAAMTFSGSLTSVNTALNGLVVTPALNFIGASTLVITCNDQGASGGGGPGIDNDTVTIDWTAVNDAPVNSVPGGQTTTEDLAHTFSAATGNALVVTDVDATTALVQVNLTATSGTITLGNASLVTFTAGDGTADASMTFKATLASLNSALDGTRFLPNLNFAGPALLTMVSNDLGNSGSGGAKQDTDAVTIDVAKVNDPPVNTVPGPQTTNEDVARVFSTGNGNAISVSDPDAASLQVTLTAGNATVTLGSTSNLTFQAGDGTADATTTFTGTVAALNAALNGTRVTPSSNFSGSASLTILTSDLGSDGTGGTLTAQNVISISVTATNDPPVAVNDVLAVVEDAPATALAVLSNDSSSPDVGETLTVTAVGTALHGTATNNSSTVSYQPVANYNGPDSFTYTVSDGNGGLASAVVSVTVSPVNDPPIAAADSFTLIQDSSGNSLAVLSNDSTAPDVGETLTISAVATPPLHGSATIASGSTRINYSPLAGYSGLDNFEYTISDGNGGSATSTVTLDIVQSNTRPVNSLPGPQATAEDSPLLFSGANGNAITVSDSPPGGTLNVQIQVTNGTFTMGSAGLTLDGNGTASVNATGLINALNTGLNTARYIPSANYFGAATLTMSTSDNDGETDLDVLTLTVSSFNDPPVNTVPATANAVEDTPIVFNFTVSDPDLSGANLIVSLVANNGTRISLPTTSGLLFSLGDGISDTAMSFAGPLSSINPALNGLSVVAPASYTGPSTLVVTSNDQGNTGSGGAREDTDTVSITWATDNDPPVNVVAAAQTMAEDTTLAFSASTGTGLSVSDPDAGGGELQITLAATNGLLTLGDSSGVVFNAGAGDGLLDATMTFHATAAALNAALEGTTFAPTANFSSGAVATITMTTSDLGHSGGPAKTDSDSIQVTVTPVNDAPVVSLPATASTNEDVARVFATSQGNAVSVADVDATALQVSLASSAGLLTLGNRSGLVFQAGDGTADATMTFTAPKATVVAAMNGMTFIPTPNFVGVGSFTILVSDLGAAGAGGPLSDEETLLITINSVNDAPDAVADTVTTFEDVGLLQIDVLANDVTAPDVGETLTLTAASTPLHGSAAITGSTITYSPAGNYNGTDSFTYTVSDGNGGVDTATVSLTVTAVNDPPNAADDTFTVAGSSVNNTLAVRTNDSPSPDIGETLTVIAVTTPAHGTAAITGTGSTTAVRYSPTTGYEGPDSFTYTLSDGVGGTDSATVSITVSPFDSRPVANNDARTTAEDGPALLAVLSNDTGTADTPLTIAITSTPTHGVAAVQGDLTILYTPAADYTGTDTFTYRVTDNDGDADSAVVTMTMTAVDDHPLAEDDVETIDEDSTASIVVVANDTGVGDRPLTVTIETEAEHGTATPAGGNVSYEPAANFFGTDTFTYKVHDADGDESSATVTVTVSPVNDPPEAVADVLSIRTGEVLIAAVLDNDVEVDGDALAVVSVSAPLHGTATIEEDGTIRYVPEATFTGTDDFTYTIDDGHGEQASAAVNVGVGLDSDEDGLLDADEIEIYATDPQLADTDGDKLSDGVEVLTSGTDPLDDDGDDDGVLDGNEDVDGNGLVDDGETSPALADSDGDGLLDGTELGLAAAQGEDTATATFIADADTETRTDPTIADTDGGSVADGDEDRNHNGRVDDGETDPNDGADDVPTNGAGGGGADGGGCRAASGSGAPDAGASLFWVLTGLALAFAGTRPRRRSR